MLSTDAVYDLEGNLKDAGSLGTSSGGFGISVGADKMKMDYVISDNLSIHISGSAKGPAADKASLKQIKDINNFMPKSEKDGFKQLIALANKARKLGAKVTFKSPANQGAIPFNQGIQMLKKASG
jgi:hypothetical protein